MAKKKATTKKSVEKVTENAPKLPKRDEKAYQEYKKKRLAERDANRATYQAKYGVKS